MQPLLCLSIDVEEDMPNWEIADPTSVSNVNALPRLALMCSRLGVKPTYLCTYPVATDPGAAALLRELRRTSECEIGTHLHPWNTPPFVDVPGRAGDERRHAYYMSELGPAKFRAKLDRLHAVLFELAGTPPRSFRAGRFGIDAATLRELLPLGYEVDSSVTPLSEHRKDGGPDFRDAPQHPYRPARDDVRRPGDLDIVEIPVSVGLTRRLSPALRRAYVHLPPATRIRGLLSRDHLGWLDYAWLYPVRFDLDAMRTVARVLVDDGAPVLNVFLHSSELAPGQSGRIRTPEDVETCFTRLAGILEHCITALGAKPVTLTEAARALRPSLGLPAASA